MRMRLAVSLLVVGLLPVVAGLLPRTALAADAITVQNGTDYPCIFGGLVDAIMDIDSGGTISFDCPANTTMNFTHQVLIDNKTLTIDGTNNGSRIIFDGGNNFKLLRVESEGDLTLFGLTLKRGFTDVNSGAAINNGIDATTTISRVTFIENHSGAKGGAIFNSGTLFIEDSRFEGNSAGVDGGAIYNMQSVTVWRSSFVNNQAGGNGGAIISEIVFPFDPSLILTSSTMAGNTAGGDGSAVYVDNVSAEIGWSTIVQPADTAPALFILTDLTITAVMLDGEGDHCAFVGGDNLTDNFSLSNDASCSFDDDASQHGIDLGLGASASLLVNGVEQTYYPLTSASPAINVGGASCPTLDQIGTGRPLNLLCDIGAIEYGGSPPMNTAPVIENVEHSPDQALEGQPVTITVTASDADGDTLTYSIDCRADDTIGPVPSAENTKVCSYPDNGSYTVFVRVSDGEAETPTTSYIVNVANVAPVIEGIETSPDSALEGQPVTITVTASDAGGDALTYSIDCRSDDALGPVPSTENTKVCIYPDDGSFTALVRVSDGEAASPLTAHIVHVANVDPVIERFDVAPTLAATGQVVALSARATDVIGDIQDLEIVFDCGGGTLFGEDGCVFSMPGTYQVGVAVTDGDEGAATASRTLQVFDPVELCANRWNGSLRWPSAACSSGEILIQISPAPATTLCANVWNGDARYVQNGQCGRSERHNEATGDDSIPVCVNRWNGSLRVSDDCSRSERGELI